MSYIWANEKPTVRGVNAIARFWRLIDKTDSCWIWTGQKDKDGYGRCRPGIGKNKVRAHRLSWNLHFGPIPDGMFVLHKCDTPSCVNPAHLFIGTNRDNIEDMVEKGRTLKDKKLPGIRRARGVDNGRSKLRSEDVIAIRSLRMDGISFLSIAQQYRIAKSTVQKICNGKLWAHLPIEEPEEAS